MIDLLYWIVQFFETVWNILTFTFEGLATLFLSLVSSISLPALFESYIPGLLSASMSVVIGLSILKMILGRDNV